MFPRIVPVLLVFISCALNAADARCPGWCNRRGTCTDPGDAGHCVCELGYSGEGCEQKLCPKSFDPITLHENRGRRSLQITTSVQPGARLSGNFLFGFLDAYVEIGASLLSMSETACSNAFSSLRGVERADCIFESVDSADGSGSFVVQFMSWSLEPFENNLFNHSGNPPLSAFSCSPAESALVNDAEPSCSVVDVPASNIPDYLQCSGRGTCDFITGQCVCERGFKGPACDDMTDNKDHIAHIHDGPFFTATVMKAGAIRTPSPDFNLFQAATSLYGDSWTNITTIRGDGLMLHRGGADFSGGMVLSPRPSRNTMELLGATTLAVKSDSLAPQDIGLGQTLTMIETVLGREEDVHIRSVTAGEEVFSVSGTGDLIVRSLASADRAFRLDQGMLSVQNAEVSSSLNVGGAIHVEDSLTLGSGFVLNPQGMTIDAASHDHAMLEIRSKASDFSGPLVEVKAASSSATFLRGIVEDTVTFDLSAKGDLTLNKIAMKSGGIEVKAGGIQIESGGMSVHGGFTLASGVLDVGESSLTSRNVRIINSGSHSVGISGTDTSNLLTVASSNTDFAGSGIDISVVDSADVNDYFFIRARHNSSSGLSDPAFSVSGSGAVHAGDVTASGRLDVGSDAVFNGLVSLTKMNVVAGKVIRIPGNSSYVTILDDGETQSNEVVFESSTSATAVGSVVVISNTDAEFTSGAAKIPPGSAILFIYDGNSWISVDALQTPMRQLLHVTDLKASNDLFIGNVTFEAARFKLSQETLIPKSALLFLSGSGFLTGTPKLTFSNGVLSTTAASIDRLAGDLDASHRTIRDAVLASPVLVNASVLALDIVMPSQRKGGVAYFDDAGRLTTMATLRLDAQGLPIFEELNNDLDMKGNKLMNADIRSSTLKDITEASIVNLKIQTLSEVTEPEDSIAVFENGYLRSTKNRAKIDKSGRLDVAAIGGFQLAGSIEGRNNEISDVKISGDSLFSGERIETRGLMFKDVKIARQYSTHSLLFVSEGGVVSHHDPSEELRLQRARLFENLLVEGDIDFVKRGALKGATIQDSPLGEFEDVIVAGKLKLTGTAERASSIHIPQKLLSINEASGAVESLADVHLTEDGSIKLNRGLNAFSLESERLTVSGLAAGSGSGDSPIAVDAKGTLINSRHFSFDSLQLKEKLSVDGSISARQLSFQDASQQGYMKVDAQGTVQITSSVSAEELDVNTGSVRNRLSAGSLIISQLGGSASASRVATVGPDGKLDASASVELEKIVALSVSIKDLMIDSSVVIKELPAASANQVLGLQSDGSVSASNEIFLKKVQVTESVVAPLVKTDKILLNGLSSGLLATDNDGSVVATRSIEVDVITSKSVEVSDTLRATKIHIGELSEQSGSILVVEKGDVKASKAIDLDALRIKDIDVRDSLSVSGSVRFDRLRPSSDSISKTTVVSVSTEGNLITHSSLALDGLVTSSLEVGEAVTFKALKSSKDAVELLTVDSEGRLSAGSKAALSSLVVSDIDVTAGSIKNLRLPTPKEFGSNDVTAPLLVNLRTSEVGTAYDLKSKSITAEEAFKSEGSATFHGDVVLSSLEHNSLVHTDGNGRLKSSKDFDLGTQSAFRVGALKSRTIEVTEDLKLMSLADSSVPPDNTASLLAFDPRTGSLKRSAYEKIGSLSLKDLNVESIVASEVKISNVKDGEQFLDHVVVVSKSGVLERSEHISLKKLRASEEVLAPAIRTSSIHIEGTRSGGILTLSDGGEVQVSGADTSISLSNAKVTGVLNVEGRMEVNSLKLGGSSAGVVISSSDGSLSASESITLSNIQITGPDSSARRLAVTEALRLPSALTARENVRPGVLSLTSDSGEVTLSNAPRLDSLEASSIKVTGVATLTKLALSGSATRGDNSVLSLSADSGLVEAKSDISLNSLRAEEVSVRRLLPTDRSVGIEIHGATLQGSTQIQPGASIRGAVEVETGSLSVTRGPAHFAAGVDVDGTLEVRGHVIGSGPYHDSSDVRFKKNVQPVAGALESIKALNAVKYDFRVDEFPERNFDAGRQVGWLAHEVEAAAPELVVRDSEGYMHVSYAHASALVAQAVRELAEEVQVLRAQVGDLQRDLEIAKQNKSI